MEIVIASAKEATKKLKEEDFDAVVSLHNPAWPSDSFPYILEEDRPCEGFAEFSGKKMAMGLYDLPDCVYRQHAQSIIDFAEELDKDDRVLIHCWAGISRSSAAAIIVYLAAFSTYSLDGHTIPCLLVWNYPVADPCTYAQEIVTRFFLANPGIWPNEDLIRHADKILGFAGHLIRAVQTEKDHVLSMKMY